MAEVLAPTAPSSTHVSPDLNTENKSEVGLRPREPRPLVRERVPSHAQNRLSTYSAKTSRSRPQSYIFPAFQSSLPYALVRDFAYPAFHVMHYGPPPEPASGTTTPSSEYYPSRRSSDPAEGFGRGNWSAGPWGGDGVLFDVPPVGSVEPLPSTIFGDDESLGEDHRRKHRKSRSYANITDFDRGRRRDSGTRDVTFEQRDIAGRDSLRHSRNYGHVGADGREARTNSQLFSRGFSQARHMHSESDMPLDREIPSSPSHSPTANRQSLGPDDEELFAGESLALYSFEPENANELRLVEGQHILVSYRHGQGWLVAEDKETGEQGLVPEAYVRLISEIPNYDPIGKRFFPMDDEDEAEIVAGEDMSMDHKHEHGTGAEHTDVPNEEYHPAADVDSGVKLPPN